MINYIIILHFAMMRFLNSKNYNEFLITINVNHNFMRNNKKRDKMCD